MTVWCTYSRSQVGPDGWLRVSIGTPGEMLAFQDALVDVTS